MNRLFKKMLEANTPKTNPDIMRGYATKYSDMIEEWIDTSFRAGTRSLPEGIVYVNHRRCTPAEEIYEASKARSGKRLFDFAKNSLYLFVHEFQYRDPNTGTMIPFPERYIYYPFFLDAGMFYLSGTKYHAVPVLSDKVFSPGTDNIFIRLQRDKLFVKRCYHELVINGKLEKTHVVWSQIYRNNQTSKKAPKTTKAFSCLAHYLFAHDGVNETFQKYLGFKPVFGESDINENNYPPDKWVICSSNHSLTGIKPKTSMDLFYEPTKIKIAIPIEKWNHATKAMVAGFFYVVDHFPDRLTLTSIHRTYIWTILLGHILFTGVYGENTLYDSIVGHFRSLDDYVDPIVKEKLAETGTNVDNFYDIIFIMIDKFNEMLTANADNINNVYGKNLEVLYYLLYDITSGLFRMGFKLSNSANKRRVTFNEAKEILNKHLKPRAIFGLTNGRLISEAVTAPDDHMYFKITSHVAQQEGSGGKRNSGSRTSIGPNQHIDKSHVDFGSIFSVPKVNPTPLARVNCFVNIDNKTGTVIPNPIIEDEINYIGRMLKYKKVDPE